MKNNSIKLIGNDSTQGIGDPRNYVSIPYSFGGNSVFAHLNTMYYHIHGDPFVYPKYTDDITLTSAAGVYATTGAITEIIPANTLVNQASQSLAFDLHWANISDISAEGTYVIDFYKGGAGSEIWIGATKVRRGSAFSQELPKRIQVPQQVAGTRISARLTSSSAGSDTLALSFEGHFYG